MPDSPPAELAQVLARAKAGNSTHQPGDRGGLRLDLRTRRTHYGGPEPAIGRERWRQMFGKTGSCTAASSTASQRAEATASTKVTMGTMTSQEMDDYLATGEPLEVAGGFTLDALGAPFIESIHGDPSTVVGISLPTLRRLIGELGVGWTSLWRTSGNTGDLPR